MKKLFYFASVAALALSSCTKDSTEIAPTQIGETAFTASMELGTNATRHQMGGADVDYSYIWDAGDMVAVNSDAQPSKNLPFITIQGGQNAVFTAVEDDLKYLGSTGTYYMAYPWCQWIEVYPDVIKDEDANLGSVIAGMEIPEVQRYRKNSFATMTAPAFIAADAEDVTASSQLKFKSAGSYFQVPVLGEGTVQSLTLGIEQNLNDRGYSAQNLSGFVDVYVYKKGNGVYDYEIVNSASYGDQSYGGQAVTVDFGENPLELKSDEATNVIFVINSGISVDGARVSVTAEFVPEETEDAEATRYEWESDGVKYETVVYDYAKWSDIKNEVAGTFENLYECIQPNDLVFGKPVTFGVGEALPANTADDFIVWAYTNWIANYEASEATNKPAVDAIDPNMFDTNGYLRPVMITSELDFGADWKANLDPANKKVTLNGVNDAYANAAMSWAKNNIEEWDGAVIAALRNGVIFGKGENAALKDLKVLGNYFMDGVAAVSDIALKSLHVAGTNDAAKVNVFTSVTENDVVIEGVTVEEATLAGGASTAQKAIVDNLYSAFLPELAVSAWDEEYNIARLLRITADTDASDAYKSMLTLPAFDVIKGAKIGKSKVLTVNDVDVYEDVVPVVMDATLVPAANEWFSVMIDGTSYWTGGVAEKERLAKDEEDVNGAHFTAEELAFAIKSVNLDKAGSYSVVLTNDIDLQGAEGKVWTPGILAQWAASYKLNVDGEVDEDAVALYSIKNANITVEAEDAVHDNMYSLFGHNATVKNINVADVTIDIALNETTEQAYAVSGLALKGSASNVSVDGLSINIAEGAGRLSNAKALKNIGGLFGVVTSTGSIDNINVNNVQIAGITKGTANIGIVFGQLKVSGQNTYFNNFVVTNSKIANASSNPLTLSMGKSLENYVAEAKYYSFHSSPIGVIFVTDAEYAANHVEHDLLVNNNSSYDATSGGARLTAGFWLPETFADEEATDANVVTSKEILADYDYAINAIPIGVNAANHKTANADIYDSWNFVAFNKAVAE